MSRPAAPKLARLDYFNARKTYTCDCCGKEIEPRTGYFREHPMSHRKARFFHPACVRTTINGEVVRDNFTHLIPVLKWEINPRKARKPTKTQAAKPTKTTLQHIREWVSPNGYDAAFVLGSLHHFLNIALIRRDLPRPYSDIDENWQIATQDAAVMEQTLLPGICGYGKRTRWHELWETVQTLRHASQRVLEERRLPKTMSNASHQLELYLMDAAQWIEELQALRVS